MWLHPTHKICVNKRKKCRPFCFLVGALVATTKVWKIILSIYLKRKPLVLVAFLSLLRRRMWLWKITADLLWRTIFCVVPLPAERRVPFLCALSPIWINEWRRAEEWGRASGAGVLSERFAFLTSLFVSSYFFQRWQKNVLQWLRFFVVVPCRFEEEQTFLSSSVMVATRDFESISGSITSIEGGFLDDESKKKFFKGNKVTFEASSAVKIRRFPSMRTKLLLTKPQSENEKSFIALVSMEFLSSFHFN